MIDLDAVAALCNRVALQVHLPLFGQGMAGDEKSPGEVVSRVDREAERLLLDGLADVTPDVPVIGEEAASEDPSLIEALHGARPVWLVDPLDGTQHFLDGSPDHAIMLALVDRARQSVQSCISLSMDAPTWRSSEVVPGATACACAGRQPTRDI